jgi:hypothetical protein
LFSLIERAKYLGSIAREPGSPNKISKANNLAGDLYVIMKMARKAKRNPRIPNFLGRIHIKKDN